LARHDELSSTERLLNLIRDEGPPVEKDAAFEAPQPIGRRISDYLKHTASFTKKPSSLGVDFGHDDLKMAKINRVSDRKVELLGYARIPFDPDIPRDHPNFSQFLRSALSQFCGQSRNLEIWSTISSARVETRHLRIPKVATKQIFNSVYWNYQRVSAFNDKETIFDFEILGESEEGGAKKIDVLSWVAPRDQIEELKALFLQAGFPLTGISIVPFAVQTLLRCERIRSNGAAVSNLYIGRDWSRIDIFSDDNLVLSRGIKAGVRTMVEALQKEIEQNLFDLTLIKTPTSDPNRIRAIKMRLKKEVELAQKLFFGYIPEQPSAEIEDAQLALKEERIFQMILPALERLVRQIERTIRHFALNFDNTRVVKIYISSGVRPHPRVLEYIAEELGLPIEVINPFVPDSGFSSLTPLPDAASEQSAFGPAMGMALASNDLTPNFLHTYKDKRKSDSAKRVNRGVFAGFFVLILVCLGVTFWQERQIREKDSVRRSLQTQLSGFEVRVDRNLILKLV
jgi:type IV pilus assembly protein PilM